MSAVIALSKAAVGPCLLTCAVFGLVNPKPALAQYVHNVQMCRDVLAAEGGGTLSRLRDVQIENGLCMVSRAAVLAIGSTDKVTQTLCVQATAAMMKEFQRRFPGRESAYTSKRC